MEMNPHEILQALEEHLQVLPTFAGYELRVSGPGESGGQPRAGAPLLAGIPSSPRRLTPYFCRNIPMTSPTSSR